MAVADRIDLTNVKGSMTNIIHNNADRLYTAQTVRELHDMLLSIFRENNLDTEASRRLLIRVIEKRTVKQGLDAIFNSYFKGANMGRDKEKVGGKPKMFKIDEKLKKIVSEEIEKIEVETEDQEITVETEGDAVKVEIESKTAKCVDCEAPVEETSTNVDNYAFFSDLDPEVDIDDVPADFEDDTVEPAEEGLFKESARGEASEALWDFVETADRDTLVMLCQGFVKWLSEDDCKDFARIYEIPVGDDIYTETTAKSTSISENAPEILDWDTSVAKADELLDDLVVVSGNNHYDDGDGYWAVEYTKWCNRYLYYGTGLNNVKQLEKLCDEYSSKLPNVSFYCIEREDDESISEIGYNLTEAEEMLSEGIEKKYIKPLKDKINACSTKQDLDEIGAYLDDFSDKDIDRILKGKLSNKDLNKMFGGYNFVDDDFPGWDFKESKVVKKQNK